MTKTRKKFLIVDDISTNRILLKIMCEKLGYDSDLAANGREALDLIRENSYDLIFLDCQMPIMDGYEISQEIRKIDSINKDRPIIAITAYVFSENKEKCLAAGMNDFIAKPLKKRDLKIVIDKWIVADIEADSIKNDGSQVSHKYVTIESKPQTAHNNEDAHILKMFIESTVNKFVSFQEYFDTKNEKFCVIGARGLKNNFKLMEAENLENFSDELIQSCTEEDYSKAGEVFSTLKVEFKTYAKSKGYEISI